MNFNVYSYVVCALSVALAILQVAFAFNIKDKWSKFLGVNLSVYLIWIAAFLTLAVAGSVGELNAFEGFGLAMGTIVLGVYFYIPLVILSVALLITGIMIKTKNNVLTNKKIVAKSFVITFISSLLVLMLAVLIPNLF